MVEEHVPFYEKIAKEAINELISIGLSFLIIIIGFNYFNFKYAWVSILSQLSEYSGLSNSQISNEFGAMVSSLAQTFPFNYLLADYNPSTAIFVGFLVLIIGIVLKLLTETSAKEFIKDMGRNLYVPAIVGFVSILFLQFFLALVAQDKYTNLASQLDSSLFIWNTYGTLFIVGITSLLFGSIIKLIAKNNRSITMKFIGNILLNASYISLGYYVIMRFISMKVFLNSGIGTFLKVFIVSGDISTFVILFTIFMFCFGLEVSKQGNTLYQKSKSTFEHISIDDSLPAVPEPNFKRWE